MASKKIHLLAAIGFLLHSLCAFSQSVIIDGELDKKYMPNENSIFNLKDKKITRSSSAFEINIKNAFKYNLTALSRQKLLFIYERMVYDGFSLSFGLGKSFGIDYFERIGSFFYTSGASSNELGFTEVFSNSTFSDSRPMIFAGAKIYYSGKSFDGGFMEITYRNERIDYQLNSKVNDLPIEGDNNIASFRSNSFTFGYGYLNTAGKRNNITNEFFVNLGVKFINYSRFEKIYRGGATVSNNANDYAYRLGLGELSYRILPSFNIGYILGFGF